MPTVVEHPMLRLVYKLCEYWESQNIDQALLLKHMGHNERTLMALMLAARVKLRAAAKDPNVEEQNLKVACQDLYCAAFAFHFHHGNPALSEDERRRIARVTAISEVFEWEKMCNHIGKKVLH